jgi:hypothetical protein
MNFDPPAPPNWAAVLSHTDGLDMKVSTRQKQGATRHKGVGAKGDNSAFPAPAGPSNPVVLSAKLPHAFASQRYRWLATLADPAHRRGASASMRTLH